MNKQQQEILVLAKKYLEAHNFHVSSEPPLFDYGDNVVCPIDPGDNVPVEVKEAIKTYDDFELVIESTNRLGGGTDPFWLKMDALNQFEMGEEKHRVLEYFQSINLVGFLVSYLGHFRCWIVVAMNNNYDFVARIDLGRVKGFSYPKHPA